MYNELQWLYENDLLDKTIVISAFLDQMSTAEKLRSHLIQLSADATRYTRILDPSLIKFISLPKFCEPERLKLREDFVKRQK